MNPIKEALLALTKDSGCNPQTVALLSEALKQWEALEGDACAELRQEIANQIELRDAALRQRDDYAEIIEHIKEALPDEWAASRHPEVTGVSPVDDVKDLVATLRSRNDLIRKMQARIQKGDEDLAEQCQKQGKFVEEASTTMQGNANEIQMLRSHAKEAKAQFKAFHKMLCERFGYHHDDNDWPRDLVSLIEHIARQMKQPTRELRLTFDSIEGAFVVTFGNGTHLKFERPKQVTGNIENWLANLRHT